MISGLVTTIASMPVDICKTRIQNMKVVNGVPEYKGAVVSWGTIRVTLLGSRLENMGFMQHVWSIPHCGLTFIQLSHSQVGFARGLQLNGPSHEG